MNKILFYIFLGLPILFYNGKQKIDIDKSLYIRKTKCSSCSDINGKHLEGVKIELLSFGVKEYSSRPIQCDYAWDVVFSEYPYDKKMDILEELLNFQGDTSVCAKSVCSYGSRSFSRPNTKTYTTQIDALYLFTVLTVSSYSPTYCPFPVLYDKETRTEINNDQKKLNQVFKIYRKWFKENKKRGFICYNVPLRDKRYEWFGSRRNFHYYEDSFQINKLQRAARSIGYCVD